MKALWKYDWYKSGIKLVVLVGGLFLLVAVTYGMSIYGQGLLPVVRVGQDSNSMRSFYDVNILPIWGLPLLTTWITGKMLTDDEQCGWRRFSGAMPLTSWQYITEKYLFGLMFMGGSMVLVMLCQTVYVVWLGVFDGWFLTLFYLRYMMVFLMTSAVFTVLALCRSFGFALLCEVLVLIVAPVLEIVGVYLTRSPQAAHEFLRIRDAIEWLYQQPEGILCGSIAAVVLYGLSYVACLYIGKFKQGRHLSRRKEGAEDEGALEV